MLTNEQHATRARGIGASEIAAVCGLNPWCGPHDIWERKTGRALPYEDTTAAEWGRYMEPAIVALWKARTGRKVRYANRHQRSLMHPKHPIVIATPDGIVDPDATLEVKTYGWRVKHHWGEPGTDDIPDYYTAQVTWAMAAAGRTKSYVVASCEREIDEYVVEYNEPLFHSLVDTAQRFWRDYIETDTPPPPDHTDRCYRVLERYYPRPLAKPMAPESDESEALAQRLRNAQTAKKEAEKLEQDIKNKLCAYIGSDYGVNTELGKVLWYPVKGRSSIDVKALAAIAREHGATDAEIDSCKKIGSDYRVLRAYFKEQ